MANAFFVRCDCRNRRFTGGKSRFLQEADGRKGIASAADELCGSAYIFHHPLLSPLRSFTLKLGRNPTLAGHGGSVSRRDHNQQTRNRAQQTWAHKLERKVKLIPSYSSGGGAFPPESLPTNDRNRAHAAESNANVDTKISEPTSSSDIFCFVEHSGFEPLTPTLPVLCATSCANAPRTRHILSQPSPFVKRGKQRFSNFFVFFFLSAL